jgi:tyrosine aminotransferase
MKTEPNPAKEMISFALGDPTIFGNLKVPDTAVEAVTECLKQPKKQSYLFFDKAQYSSVEGHSLSASDVIVASGYLPLKKLLRSIRFMYWRAV